ncbi:MAG: hypothetical protein Q7U10_11505 [Thermodesulfovibrionia bacterium]|nr:hypothetical protein [Thermodesulfovibrionia bacterium]
MDYVIHGLINFLSYISIPILIRYVILRRPIESKWIAISILVIIYFVFATLINISKDELQRALSEANGLTYKPAHHMFGAPILDMTMVLSYFILRRRRKESGPLDWQESKMGESSISSLFSNIDSFVTNASLKDIIIKGLIIAVPLFVIAMFLKTSLSTVDDSSTSKQSAVKAPFKMADPFETGSVQSSKPESIINIGIIDPFETKVPDPAPGLIDPFEKDVLSKPKIVLDVPDPFYNVTTSRTKSPTRTDYVNTLLQLVPDLVSIRDNPQFAQFLAQRDSATGKSYFDLAKEGDANLDAYRVASFYLCFKNRRAN